VTLNRSYLELELKPAIQTCLKDPNSSLGLAFKLLPNLIPVQKT
jgi:hypothetical protein